MGKSDFLKALRRALRRAGEEEREKALTYYSEMIDDRMEEGLSEEQAVEAIGGVNAAAGQVLTELAGEGRLKNKLTASQIALIAITSVIWLPLLIAALAIAVSLLIAMWAVIISLWVAVVSLAAGALVGIMEVVITPGAPMKLVMCGMTLGCLGGTVLGFIGMRNATKYAALGTFNCFKLVRRHF